MLRGTTRLGALQRPLDCLITEASGGDWPLAQGREPCVAVWNYRYYTFAKENCQAIPMREGGAFLRFFSELFVGRGFGLPGDVFAKVFL